MISDTRSIGWEAPEHRHIEKTTDWFWVVGIIAVSGSVVSIILDDVLFSIVILLGATTMILFSHHKPKLLSFEVSVRGIRIGKTLYSYDSLEQYSIDEEAPEEPQLIVRSKHMFMPLLIMPLPEEYIDDIDAILSERLPEVHMHEPLSHRLLEFFGF
jgi:hypothetical protein